VEWHYLEVTAGGRRCEMMEGLIFSVSPDGGVRELCCQGLASGLQ